MKSFKEGKRSSQDCELYRMYHFNFISKHSRLTFRTTIYLSSFQRLCAAVIFKKLLVTHSLSLFLSVFANKYWCSEIKVQWDQVNVSCMIMVSQHVKM